MITRADCAPTFNRRSVFQLREFLFCVFAREVATRIDDADKTTRFEAAHYRFSARMREIELQFEAKASELRAAFIAEVAKIGGPAAEEDR